MFSVGFPGKVKYKQRLEGGEALAKLEKYLGQWKKTVGSS